METMLGQDFRTALHCIWLANALHDCFCYSVCCSVSLLASSFFFTRSLSMRRGGKAFYSLSLAEPPSSSLPPLNALQSLTFQQFTAQLQTGTIILVLLSHPFVHQQIATTMDPRERGAQRIKDAERQALLDRAYQRVVGNNLDKFIKKKVTTGK